MPKTTAHKHRPRCATTRPCRATARFCCALAVVPLLACLTSAQADGIVNLCQKDTQEGNGSNLAGTISQGGDITFDCPAGTIIQMTVGHTVPPGTTIDGGDKVTLDAHGAPLTMFSAPNGLFTMQRITLQGGKVNRTESFAKASIIFAEGNLSLTNVTIRGSEFPILVEGNAIITDSKFLENSGPIFLQEGTIERSTFSGNTMGAIDVEFPTGRVSIVASTFDGNTGGGAITLSQQSGGNGAGEVSIRRSVFRNNASQTFGGAIRIFDAKQEGIAAGPVHFEFSYNQFIKNSAKRGGAIQADLANTKGLIIEGGIFLNNVASESGGALAWNGRSVTVTHSLFRANRAGGSGGAIFASDPERGASWGVTNSLFAENVAAPSSGALDMSYASIINSTVANNVGFGIVVSGTQTNFIANTILSKNSAGNCKGVGGSAFNGSNLQFGGSDCPNVSTEDPFLDSLFVPSLGSPALEIGQFSICKIVGTDIIFQPRGNNGKCAVGAFERPPVRRIEAAIESQRTRVYTQVTTSDDLGKFSELKTLLGSEEFDVRPVQVTGLRITKNQIRYCNEVNLDNAKKLRNLLHSGIGDFALEQIGSCDKNKNLNILEVWLQSGGLVPIAHRTSIYTQVTTSDDLGKFSELKTLLGSEEFDVRPVQVTGLRITKNQIRYCNEVDVDNAQKLRKLLRSSMGDFALEQIGSCDKNKNLNILEVWLQSGGLVPVAHRTRIYTQVTTSDDLGKFSELKTLLGSEEFDVRPVQVTGLRITKNQIRYCNEVDLDNAQKLRKLVRSSMGDFALEQIGSCDKNKNLNILEVWLQFGG
jgi:hypothetical protein